MSDSLRAPPWIGYVVSGAANGRVSYAVREAMTRDVYDEVNESVYVVVNDEVDFLMSHAVSEAVWEAIDGEH